MDRPILAVSLLLAGWQAGRAQTADLRPEFDVASVKPSDVVSQLMLVRDGKIRLGMHGGPGTDQPHRLTGNAVKLADLIVRAYSIQPYQLSGPPWLDSRCYDIVAQVPEGARKEQLVLMLQRLLAERFKLTLHKETRELSAFHLTIGRAGPRLTESVEAVPPPDSAAPVLLHPDGYPIIPPGATYHLAVHGRRTTLSLPGMTMEEFAQQMTTMGLLGQPVIDATGLRRRYDITLHYVPDSASERNGVSSASSGDAGEPGAAAFAAIQSQLGLKLEAKKSPIEILVVDHVEKTPTGN